MKLNLGCGLRKLDGYVNVDSDPFCEPDALVDLNAVPWPWADDSALEVLLIHVLEHLGPTVEGYLSIIRELWRICAPDARVTVLVPHPRHNGFLNDPTHVRPVTAEGLAMFSQSRNRQWLAAGYANTPLGLSLGVDFAVEDVNHDLAEPWRSDFQTGKLSTDDLRQAELRYNNVIEQTTIILRAIKPAGAETEV